MLRRIPMPRVDDTYSRNYRAVTGNEQFIRIGSRELAELAHKAQQGDRKAMDRVIVECSFFVKNIAYRMYHSKSRTIDVEDMIQYGMLGLVTSIQKFEYERGLSFLTYANWWVMQSIDRGVMTDHSDIKIPVHVWATLRTLTKQFFNSELHTKKTLAKITYEEFHELVPDESEMTFLLICQHFFKPLISLDKESEGADGEDGEELHNLISSEDFTAIMEESIHQEQIEKILTGLLHILPPKERFIMIRRFGLFDSNNQTLEEIGAILKLTRERIRQLETKALRRIKGYLAQNGNKLPTEQAIATYVAGVKFAKKALTFNKEFLTEKELHLFDDVYNSEIEEENEDDEQ
jgi:RNA polymerase sigma factor (sigma-70 family)